MTKRYLLLVASLFLVFNLITGCKPKSSGTSSPGGSDSSSRASSSSNPGSSISAGNYFQTPFQDESQFIVEMIVADLAEQIYYAKFHHLPDADHFQLSADETADSSFYNPTYEVAVTLDNKLGGLKTRLKINGPIWSPEVYDGVVKVLAGAVGLAAGTAHGTDDTALLAKLADGKAATLESENQKLSAKLADDFGNPALHEQAAVLLGAFTLREHSGDFYEIRSPLCRITAHLAMARYLGGGDASTVNGCVARAILLTLMNDQAAALTQLDDIKTNNDAATSWVRALRAWNTRDYRPLEKAYGLSGIECFAWFDALDRSANTDIAWSKLSDVQKRTVDFVRIANAGSYSVETGHQLLALSLPLEFEEIATVYQLSQHKKLTKAGLVAALNQMPDRCFSPGPDGQPGVCVIGWGLWAGLLQRQLCHAVEQNFDFLQRKWGVPDDAKTFSTKCDAMLGGLRLYPFVRRFNCTDVAAYHSSVDDGFKVTVATPQLVPAECWDYLCYWFTPSEMYQPNPNPHLNEWHKHNPPPGTAYNPLPRFDHPSLTNRPDTIALVDKLHDLAPYDENIAWYIWKTKYHEKPTYAEALALYQPVLAYDDEAMEKVAAPLQDQPAKYVELMSRAAAVNPSDYFTLADYYTARQEDDQAAASIEKGNAHDPDSVRAAEYAGWLVKYYLKQGRVADARREADFGGDVYSAPGLLAKAEFLEATGDYPGAYQWFANDEERYDDPAPLIAFCLRYKAKTGDSRYDGEVRQRLGKLFPQGIEKVGLGDFQSAPTDGVLIVEENDVMRRFNLHQDNVIVAVSGVRIHNDKQYNYARNLSSDPAMDLIVWQGNQYHEIKARPPGHRFGGGEFGDYVAK